MARCLRAPGLRAQAGLPGSGQSWARLGGTGGVPGAWVHSHRGCPHAQRARCTLTLRSHPVDTHICGFLPVPREARGSLLHDSLQPVRYRRKLAQRGASASPGSHSKKGAELGAQGSRLRRIKRVRGRLRGWRGQRAWRVRAPHPCPGSGDGEGGTGRGTRPTLSPYCLV